MSSNMWFHKWSIIMNSYNCIFHHWLVKYFCWACVFVLQIWENRRDSWRMSLTWNWSPSVNCAPATAAPGTDVEETRTISLWFSNILLPTHSLSFLCTSSQPGPKPFISFHTLIFATIILSHITQTPLHSILLGLSSSRLYHNTCFPGYSTFSANRLWQLIDKIDKNY